MSARRLPRDLRYAVNRLAHEHAKYHGRNYAEEKAGLHALAVTWLAAGDTQEQVLAKLQGGRSAAAAKRRETLKALLQRLKEMP